ncbi:uncharacterized protein KY384_002390 [Bacidia gigantensis]|uniref:uncharacterized protein n=1 Tax=Bacidia gigantensis TaxID=2732470 RepID=UPI001D0404C5|nr:uncharacterized protein KY384_002390 [Bacidia gigantensis]KAG8532513.1 hypothetical protein KY384_002390 [Bacidia gigantensis]
MSLDPVSTTIAGLNASIKIFEVTYLLKAVGEQTNDLLRTIRHVDRGIQEVQRLCDLKRDMIDSQEKDWIETTIADVKDALLEIAQLLEPARVNKATTGSINIITKTLWVFRDSPKVRDKHSRLSLCYQTLISVLNGLQAKCRADAAPVPNNSYGGPPPPYTTELERMFTWRKEKAQRRSSSDVKPPALRPELVSSVSDHSNSIPKHLKPEMLERQLAPSPTRMSRPHSAFSYDEALSHQAAPSMYYSSLESPQNLQSSTPHSSTPRNARPSSIGFLPVPNRRSSMSPSSDTTYPQCGFIGSAVQPLADSELPLHASNGNIMQEPLMPGFPSNDNGRAIIRTRGKEWLANYAALEM